MTTFTAAYYWKLVQSPQVVATHPSVITDMNTIALFCAGCSGNALEKRVLIALDCPIGQTTLADCPDHKAFLSWCLGQGGSLGNWPALESKECLTRAERLGGVPTANHQFHAFFRRLPHLAGRSSRSAVRDRHHIAIPPGRAGPSRQKWTWPNRLSGNGWRGGFGLSPGWWRVVRSVIALVRGVWVGHCLWVPSIHRLAPPFTKPAKPSNPHPGSLPLIRARPYFVRDGG